VRRHLVLVGMMGSGKTTVGRIVAERLGRAFFDSDEVIEARTGRTVREIFASEGEAAFRRLETQVLAEALARPEPSVIAAAGGTVLAAENRRAMRDGAQRVVWLRADPAALATRVAGGAHRPLLDDDPAGTLARLEAEREPLYGEVADAVIDTVDLRPNDVAERVLALVAEASA
jgi:shikimate kinase